MSSSTIFIQEFPLVLFFFVTYNPKFLNPSWRKVIVGEEKERKKERKRKNAINSGHIVL
jgi:hypothetical protein